MVKPKGWYGKSKDGNFEVDGVFGVPHPYKLTPRHINWAADRYSGIISQTAIEAGEKAGMVKCGVPDCELKYAEHEQALAVACRKNVHKDAAAKAELEAYLKAIVDEAEKNGYAGFVLVDHFSKEGEPRAGA